MPQTLIVIFLLFFAVLAFGWFYWQRAKARSTTDTSASTEAETTDTTPAS
jgi:predicted negative regulator of RcsB-dependent stress response